MQKWGRICGTLRYIVVGESFVSFVVFRKADSGNFPWYMTDSIAVLEDSYSEVVVDVIDLALNWQLFSDVGRPRSFVNVMSTNSTLDPCLFVSAVLCRILLQLCSYVNMNFGSVRNNRVKLFFFFLGGGGGGAYIRD